MCPGKCDYYTTEKGGFVGAVMINVMLVSSDFWAESKSQNLFTTEGTEDHRGVHVPFEFRIRGKVDCQDLWADDYFVGGGREAELNAVGLVAGDGFGKIEGGEFDFSDPGSGGVVAGTGVEEAVDDGVVGNLFTVTVAEEKYIECVMRRS
jgi:hypothetical protein